MSGYKVTKKNLIRWVNRTVEGRQAFFDNQMGTTTIEDYLVDYGNYPDIVSLLANDIGYPGDGNWAALKGDLPPMPVTKARQENDEPLDLEDDYAFNMDDDDWSDQPDEADAVIDQLAEHVTMDAFILITNELRIEMKRNLVARLVSTIDRDNPARTVGEAFLRRTEG